jgi:GAF domain-containing protein/HAMP domain-containing protein
MNSPENRVSPNKVSPGGAETDPWREAEQVPHSIRRRFLILAAGLTIGAIILIGTVSIDSARNVIRRAQEVSGQSLRSQVESYLVQINSTIASQNSMIIDQAMQDVQAAADAATEIYNQSDRLSAAPIWPATEQVFVGPNGQFLNGPQDISSVFVPSTAVGASPATPGMPITDARELSEGIQQDIELGAYLDFTLKAIKENNPDAAAIYLGTVNDVTRYYPNIELGKVVPEDFAVTQRPWYVSSLEKNQNLATPKPVLSPVYLDATGLGLVTTVAVPVYTQKGSEQRLVGVVGLDLTLNTISKNIESAAFLETSFSFLVDDQGHALIFPEQGYRNILGFIPSGGTEDALPSLIDENVRSTSPEFAAVVGQMTLGNKGFKSIQTPSGEYFVAYSPLGETGLSLGSVVAAQNVLKSVESLQADLSQTAQNVLLTRLVPIGVLVSIALIAMAMILTNRMVKPIQKLADVSPRLVAQNIGVELTEFTSTASPAGADLLHSDVEFRNVANRTDEIGMLARTLNRMANQVRQGFSELERRVEERTVQLERRSLQLQTAAEVARDITQAKNLDALLPNAVNLIAERFGLYSVNIFLVDELEEYAYLRAASGEAGSHLVEQNLRLRVGQQGMVGYVTRYGQLRLAENVQQDATYMAAALLPDTRSEVTLPLRSGGKVIGALDVQSTQESAFNPDDLTVLQTLADQIAVAIENLRLVERLQATLEEANLLYQHQARETWSRLVLQGGSTAYEYDRLNVRPVEATKEGRGPVSIPKDPNVTETESHKPLVVPLSLRGQVIGFIEVESDDPQHQWADDEIAIIEATANRTALTVENARLLAESQQRAAHEQIASEVTARMRASLNMDTVLQTAIREISQKLGLAQVEVHLGDAYVTEASIESKRREGLQTRDGNKTPSGEEPDE